MPTDRVRPGMPFGNRVLRGFVMKRVLLAAGAALVALTGAAAAQNGEAGRKEYMVACAVCHGESGMGNGQFAELMNVEVPGLTGLAKNNDGVFPYLQVFHLIDGRSGVAAHGSPMPLWGERYSATSGDYYGPYGAEVVTRGRIAVLTDYIESIQD